MQDNLPLHMSTLTTWIPVIAAIIAATVAILSLPIAYWLTARREHKQWLRNERLSTCASILKSMNGLIENSEDYLKLYSKRHEIIHEIHQLEEQIEKLNSDKNDISNKTELKKIEQTAKNIRANECEIYEQVNEKLNSMIKYGELLNAEKDRFVLISSNHVQNVIPEIHHLIIRAFEVGTFDTKYAKAADNLAELVPKFRRARDRLIKAFRSDLGL